MYTTRRASESDKNFIYSTYLRSLYFGHPGYNVCDSTSFYKNMGEYLTKLLLKSEVIVACLTDDPDVILGYAILNAEIAYWVYVKASFRALGIASLLCKDTKVAGNISTAGVAICKKKNIKIDLFC